MVNLIYDWDYFHYNGVIPNLECAKLAAYEKARNNIAVFNPNLEIGKYSKVYFRKEYEDGIYPPELSKPNVVYGGRAFSNTYKPFPIECEKIRPDFSIYEPYLNYYGPYKKDQAQIKTLLNSTHARLSIDGKKLSFQTKFLRPSHPNIILHDYNLASLPNSRDFIIDLCNTPKNKDSYRVGNKYPI